MSKAASKIVFIRFDNTAGPTYGVTCPDCECVTQVAEGAWWSQTCDCGVYWTINIAATGKNIDE